MSEDSKLKILTVILTRGAYISESAEIAFRTALRAHKKGYQVNVFLYLDGVWVAHIKGDKNFNNPGDWLKRVIRKGINVCMCHRCSSARDLVDGDYIEGVKPLGTYELVGMLRASDKVLTFGG